MREIQDALLAKMITVGKALLEFGESETAIDTFQNCLKLNSASVEAVKGLSAGYRQLERTLQGNACRRKKRKHTPEKHRDLMREHRECERHLKFLLGELELLDDPFLRHGTGLNGDNGTPREEKRRELLACRDEILSRDEALGDEEDGVFGISHELHNLASDFYRIEEFESALDLYTRVLNHRADLLESRFNRSLCLCKLQRYREALADMDAVIDMNRNLPEAWYTRALYLDYLGEYALSAESCDKALEIDPNYHRAREQRDKMLARLKGNQDGSSGSASPGDNADSITDFSRFRIRAEENFSHVALPKEILDEFRSLISYFKAPDLWKEYNVTPAKGILLYGIPGVGKTLLARALAGELEMPIYVFKPGDLLSMWYGQSTRNIAQMFTHIRENDPRSVVFFDEFDAFGSTRVGVEAGDACHNRTVSAFLQELDGFVRRGDLIVIAATNCPQNVDPAFFRPGRFEYAIHVPAPGAADLGRIFAIEIGKIHDGARRNVFAEDIDFDHLGKAAVDRDLVGDDVKEIVRRTGVEHVRAIQQDIIRLSPSGTEDLRRRIEEYETAPWRRSQDEWRAV